ncbi:DNA repair protein RadC [Arenicella sp. 4NH20-0111]|uniref:RadC family protein n=1 Tax=Arenicella sp. 4NH20-0111 TaxID=3127648 RepID=UPI00310C6639
MTTRHLPIKDWPQTEQPREKLLNKGPDTLSDAELLAIFLRTGIPGKSAITIARDALLEAGSLRRLLNMSPVDLCKFKGVGTAKYVQFQAGLELGRRYLKEQLEKGTRITSPDISRDYLTLQLRDKPYEAFYVMYLNSKHSVIHSEELFRGTIDSASVPIREVVKEALKFNAAALIVAHNHPSGVAEPSGADKALTETLSLALEMVGVNLLDHFVVGDGEVVSFAEMGCL